MDPPKSQSENFIKRTLEKIVGARRQKIFLNICLVVTSISLAVSP
jgi:hypothetical protein